MLPHMCIYIFPTQFFLSLFSLLLQAPSSPTLRLYAYIRRGRGRSALALRRGRFSSFPLFFLGGEGKQKNLHSCRLFATSSPKNLYAYEKFGVIFNLPQPSPRGDSRRCEGSPGFCP
ncbi:hypothetical protein B0I35DRAFT_428875 [Stachybotrys elegans]|uniref:Secreted protein n=1 Tax=Stachybotrys elegans TaxID=80388 RepID=A0A8K0WU43_9HYPO|nr:hypothetical protein B0I35DRAFT_428875 [Stachybotrys elegans]